MVDPARLRWFNTVLVALPCWCRGAIVRLTETHPLRKDQDSSAMSHTSDGTCPVAAFLVGDAMMAQWRCDCEMGEYWIQYIVRYSMRQLPGRIIGYLLVIPTCYHYQVLCLYR